MPTLSKRVVDAAAPQAREFTIYDSKISGLGLRVKPSGVKSFTLIYKSPAGTMRRLTLGKLGDVTPDQARKLALVQRDAIRNGGDPAGNRKALRCEPTLNHLLDRWVTEHGALHLKPSTLKSAKAYFDRAVRPKLGRLKLHELTRDRIKRWHADMAPTPYGANRSLAYLSSVLGVAWRDWGVLPDNPCRGLRRFREEKRSRYFDTQELSGLTRELDRLLDLGSARQMAGAFALKLLALTGCRPSEVLRWRWEHVDWERGFIKLVDAKTGGRYVAISDELHRLLVLRKEDNGFIVRKGDRPLTVDDVGVVFERAASAANMVDARPYDLRHTLGTMAAAAGLNAFAIRDLLGHKTIGMSNIYVERASDAMKAAANIAASRVAGMMATASGAVPAAEGRPNH